MYRLFSYLAQHTPFAFAKGNDLCAIEFATPVNAPFEGPELTGGGRPWPVAIHNL